MRTAGRRCARGGTTPATSGCRCPRCVAETAATKTSTAAAVVAVIVLAVGTALVVANLRAPMPAGWIAGPRACVDRTEGFAVGVPDGWYANDTADWLPACRLFSVETVEIADPNDLPNVPIRLKVATGDVGFAGEEVVDRIELTIADLPALRFLTEGPNGPRLTYVIGLDGTLPLENNPDRFLLITTLSGDETFERDMSALEKIISQFAVIGR